MRCTRPPQNLRFLRMHRNEVSGNTCAGSGDLPTCALCIPQDRMLAKLDVNIKFCGSEAGVIAMKGVVVAILS